MRFALAAVFILACSSDDAPAPTLATLTVTPATPNTAIVGNTLDCGAGSACDGSKANACSITVEAGTHISLQVVYPVCPEVPAYTSFQWTSPPCAAGPSSTCEFDITDDVQILVGGGTTLR